MTQGDNRKLEAAQRSRAAVIAFTEIMQDLFAAKDQQTQDFLREMEEQHDAQ